MKLLFTFVLFFAVFTIYGGDFSPFQVSYKTNGTNSVMSNYWKVQLSIPFQISGKNRIIISPIFKSISIDDSILESENYFYLFATRLSWQNKLSERMSITVSLLPSISSSYSIFSLDAISGKAAAAFNLKQSEHIVYNFGLAYTYQFHTHTIMPFIGIKWQPSEHFNITGKIPFRAELEWVPNSKLSTGIIYHGENFASDIPSTLQDNYFKLKEKNLGWKGSINVFRSFWITTDIGYSFKRCFDSYKAPENGKWNFVTKFIHPKEASIFEHKENGVYAKFGIVCRLHEDILE